VVKQSERTPGQRRFIYLLGDGLQATVIRSQVITILRRMAERGLVFDLFIWQARPPRSERPAVERRLAEVRRLLPGRVRLWKWMNVQFLVRQTQSLDAPTEPPPAFRETKPSERLRGRLRWIALRARAVALQCGILACLARSLLRRETIVVHARSGSLDVALGLKRCYAGFRVLADFRGDRPAEYLYNAALLGISAHDRLIRLEHARLREQDRRALREADSVQCVSNALRRRLEQEHGIGPGRIRVVPGLADDETFFFDPEAREKVRGELGVEERRLFIYSGSMLAWQAPRVLLQVWRDLSRSVPAVALLLLTPEEERARRLVGEMGFPQAVEPLVRSARYEEVRQYLSAADVGLLLREPHPLNEVASPTKFAEYVLCGLSVIVSRGVGDCGEIVETDGLGVVLEGYDDPSEVAKKVAIALQIAQDGRRHERAEKARVRLGLSAQLDAWARLYREL
jgi:glycosyltransferase involved in cell wall biosynthesis